MKKEFLEEACDDFNEMCSVENFIDVLSNGAVKVRFHAEVEVGSNTRKCHFTCGNKKSIELLTQVRDGIITRLEGFGVEL